MIDEHAAAVLTMLNAVISSPVKIFDGKVDASTDPRTNPYVVVYFDSSDPEADFTAAPWSFELTATCHCVGGSAQAARKVADLVRLALVGLTPSVSGRSCMPITRDPGTPPQRDESTGTLVMDQVDQYTIRSVPG